MSRLMLIAAVAAVAGCGTTVQSGHMGLVFLRSGGLQRDTLKPGFHHHGARDHIEQVDVTYSTRNEELHPESKEGAELTVKMSIRYRPIVAELYELLVEIGPNYYEEVIQPEFRTAVRGVFARHSYIGVQQINSSLEDEIEAEMRRRIAGHHIEVTSVTMEDVSLPSTIVNAVQARLAGEQEAVRKKGQLEADAQRRKVEMEQEAQRATLAAQAELLHKQNERKLAEEQAAIDRVKSETEAATKVTEARAEAEATKLLASAHAAEKKAEATTLTPLMVMLHAYDALGKLGGSGTTVMLGDWSHVPNFLFPPSVMGNLHAQKAALSNTAAH
jgi:regulator of protease activity HflC (stomatin/prohibitin superfamily)